MRAAEEDRRVPENEKGYGPLLFPQKVPVLLLRNMSRLVHPFSLCFSLSENALFSLKGHARTSLDIGYPKRNVEIW